jgi:hypothetical protein
VQDVSDIAAQPDVQRPVEPKLIPQAGHVLGRCRVLAKEDGHRVTRCQSDQEEIDDEDPEQQRYSLEQPPQDVPPQGSYRA